MAATRATQTMFTWMTFRLNGEAFYCLSIQNLIFSPLFWLENAWLPLLLPFSLFACPLDTAECRMPVLAACTVAIPAFVLQSKPDALYTILEIMSFYFFFERSGCGKYPLWPKSLHIFGPTTVPPVRTHSKVIPCLHCPPERSTCQQS